MDKRTWELRQVLMGRYTYETDTAISAAANLLQVQSGVGFSGLTGVRILGTAEYRRQYMIAGKLAPAQEACVRILCRMGTQVLLTSAPDTLAVFCWPAFRRPRILTLESRENQLLLCYVTGKSLLAKLQANRFFASWEKMMPESLTETEVRMTPDCREEPDEQIPGKKKKAGKHETR